jgi:hypothetical protein
MKNSTGFLNAEQQTANRISNIITYAGVWNAKRRYRK